MPEAGDVQSNASFRRCLCEPKRPLQSPDPPYIDLFLDQRSLHLKSNNIFFFFNRKTIPCPLHGIIPD